MSRLRSLHRLIPAGLVLALALAACDSTTPAPATPPVPPAPSATATLAGPTATPAPPTATPVPPTATPAPRTLAGHTLDAYTGRPLAHVNVKAGAINVTSGEDGTYSLGAVPEGTSVQAIAPGYAPATLDSGSGATLDIALRPTTLRGKVTDSATGKPIAGVIVRVDLTPGDNAAPAAPTGTPTGSQPLLEGTLPLLPVSQVLTATETAPPAAATMTDTITLTPTATPTLPAIMPTPFANDKMILAVTGADGSYQIDNAPANPLLTFKMPGYKLTKVQPGRAASSDVALEPFHVKALYLTANAASYDPLFKPIMEAIDTTEVNAIVLNIQDDNARVVYKTNVQMAVDSDALDLVLPNIKDVVAGFHKKGIYVIARMVTFMQPAVAEANPGLAVRSKATGKPWKGGELSQQRWLDPTNPAARQYPLALAREAAQMGFDEIQFDYIRFPSDPAPGYTWDDMSFSQPADTTTKPQYIAQFAREAHDMLNTTDAFMSIDVFGYTMWPNQNGEPLNAGIGQVAAKLVGNTDYICPMIYPSHFSAGEAGFQDPNAHPYEIIKQAGIYTANWLKGQRTLNRPWLQAFDWHHIVYDGHLMRLQIDASDETGGSGWMFWDPSNVYYSEGFLPEK
jgi:hypothetical protein